MSADSDATPSDANGMSPMDFGPTKYDDVDYHEGAAAESGQPREHAFTHIGIYLAWLIRHDLHDEQWFPSDDIAAVKRGDRTGSDLADHTDWKLLSDLMTAEGSAFSDARYEAYLGEYSDLFADEPGYGMPEDGTTYARVEPLIDRLYADWVASDRSEAEPRPPSPLDTRIDAMFAATVVPWEGLESDAKGPMEIQFDVDGRFEVRRLEMPHVAPDLEALVPTDLVDPPIEMSSVSATDWGSSLVNRALKELGVRPRDAMVATGMGGTGERTLDVTLYRVPGAPAERLDEAFASAIHRPRRAAWQRRRVGDTDVRWAEGSDGDLWFAVTYWTRDNLVLQLNGPPDDMEMAIRRLS